MTTPMQSAPDSTLVRRRGNWWLTPVLAVTTLFFAGLTGWFWMRDAQDAAQVEALQAQLASAQSQSRQMVAAADEFGRMVVAPGTIEVGLAQQPGGPAGRAGVLYNAQSGLAVFAGQLPRAPAHRIYQLWLVPVKGAPMSLGVFSAGEPTTTLTGRVTPGVAAKAFAVTVEPGFGMPQPTGPKVLVGAAG